jgi:hypothetical protein
VTSRLCVLQVLAAPLLALPVAAASGSSPALDLLKSAIDPNPRLQTYTAAATLSASLHGAVPVQKTFKGTAYYSRPQTKIVFENLSGPYSRFKELTTTTPSFEEATADYDIAPRVDDGTLSTYVLVPSKPGRRVKSLTLTVDDRTALIARAAWTYTDGGRLSFEPHYSTVGSYKVVTNESIAARFPAYSVDGTLHLSGYQFDVRIEPGVFGASK